jgi:hypothetical protein
MTASYRLLFTFLLCAQTSLMAEVEQIIIKWNALTCLSLCPSSIQMNIEGIRQTSNVQVNGFSGVATMGWSANYPFSYEPFRAAFAATGVLIRDMRVRVRGNIRHDADNFYLVSIGDDARFLLIGPLQPQPGRYIPKYSLVSYPLSPRIREQLMVAEANNFTVVISGPLFLPEKYPRTLVTEEIRIHAKESMMDPRFMR